MHMDFALETLAWYLTIVYCSAGKCRRDEFQCYNGECISIDKVQDMTLDCVDRSDEYPCRIGRSFRSMKCLRRHNIYGPMSHKGPVDLCRRITKDGKMCSSFCKGLKGYGYMCQHNNKREYCHQIWCDINSSIRQGNCDFKASFCGWSVRSNASIKIWTSEDEGSTIQITTRNLSRTVISSPLSLSGLGWKTLKYTVRKDTNCVWSLNKRRDLDSRWQNEDCISCEKMLKNAIKTNLIMWTYGAEECKLKLIISSIEYHRNNYIKGVGNTNQVCRQNEIICDNACVHPSVINDGVNDCMNRKDEFGHTPCSINEKQCKSGKCIPVLSPPSLLRKCSDQEGLLYENTSIKCPSDYLCKQGNIFSDPICLKKEQLCDGIPQCPHWDDENKCPIRHCPETCDCSSYTFKCPPEALAKIPSQAHFIDISGHDITLNEICSTNRIPLVNINISRCGILNISCLVANNRYPNLKTIDASYNNITVESFISENNEGRYIIFNGNPIRQVSYKVGSILRIAIKDSGMKRIRFRKVKDVYIIFIDNYPSNPIYEITRGGCTIIDINLSYNLLESVDFLRECWSFKFVDLSWNLISNLAFASFVELLELNLAYNRISLIPSSLNRVKYLEHLNLSNNRISTIETGAFELRYLKNLDLGNNKLKSIPLGAFDSLSNIEEIHLKNNDLHTIDIGLFKNLFSARMLDISNNGIQLLQRKTFLNMTKLTKLYMKGNNVAMYKDIYYGLSVLEKLTVDTYSLCCARPRSVTKERCYSPKLSISSCQYLLSNGVLGVSIWYATVFIITCCAILTYRHVKDRHQNGFKLKNILLHISIADFLFGICLFMIGTKDVESKGVYGLSHDKWIRSIWCDMIRLLSFLCLEFTTLFSVSVSLNISTTKTGQRIVWPSLWIGSFFITVTSFVLNKFVITDSSALHHICLMIPLLYRNSTSDTWNMILTCFHTTCVVVVLVSECFKLFRRKKSCHMRCNNNVIDLLVFGISFRNVFLCIKDNAYIIMEMIPRTIIPCNGLNEKSNRLMIVTEPGHKIRSKCTPRSTTAKGIQVQFSDNTDWKYCSRNVKVVRHVIICDAPAYHSTDRNSEVKVEIVDMSNGRFWESIIQYNHDNETSQLIQ